MADFSAEDLGSPGLLQGTPDAIPSHQWESVQADATVTTGLQLVAGLELVPGLELEP